MSDKICIYHASCMDGFGAAWVVYQKFANSCEYVPAQYGEDPPDVVGKEVFLVDFSYKKDVMVRMAKQAKRFTIIDHHKTAQSELQQLLETQGNPEINGIFDMNHSGAILTWKWFFPDYDAPLFLKYIQDRDLWSWNLDHSKEINLAMATYQRDFGTWNRQFGKLHTNLDFGSLRDQGRALVRDQDAAVASMVARAWEIQICSFVVPTVNCTGKHISELGNVLCKGKPFSATYFDMRDERIYSLRSDENGEDVSKIAAVFGGGGHKHAAGFKVPLHTHVFESH